jgi:hypothetical protein
LALRHGLEFDLAGTPPEAWGNGLDAPGALTAFMGATDIRSNFLTQWVVFDGGS